MAPRLVGNMLFVSVLIALTATAVPAIAAGNEPESIKSLGARYAQEVRPLLKRFCLKCHSSQFNEGEPDLERFEVFDDVRRDPSAWEKINVMLGSGEMPPKDSEQLDTGQRKQLLA